jgi:hypothetical protein
LEDLRADRVQFAPVAACLFSPMICCPSANAGATCGRKGRHEGMGPFYELTGPALDCPAPMKTCITFVLLLCLGRKVVEHLFHALVQILDVLVGLVGKRVAGRTPENQCF